MNSPPAAEALYAAFSSNDDRSDLVEVSPGEMPEPYRGLLVHTFHMTVTVEGHYGDAVDVIVLETARHANIYARKIVLALRGSGRIVQFGIVAIDLSLLSSEVRAEILAELTPLGRVLIEHNVLRHIEPAGYFRTEPSPKLCEWLQLETAETLYGRLGVIHTDGKPAIRVLEILSPTE